MKLFRIVAVVAELLMGSQVETEARGVSKGVHKTTQKNSNAQSRAKDAPILVDCRSVKAPENSPLESSAIASHK